MLKIEQLSVFILPPPPLQLSNIPHGPALLLLGIVGLAGVFINFQVLSVSWHFAYVFIISLPFQYKPLKIQT